VAGGGRDHCRQDDLQNGGSRGEEKIQIQVGKSYLTYTTKMFQFHQRMVLYSTDTLFFQQFQFNQSNTVPVSRLRIKFSVIAAPALADACKNALYEV
jgi:hypothetical protein